jgi:hypothetical protein
MLLRPDDRDPVVLAKRRNPETLARALRGLDWPSRPMTLVRNAWIFAAETESTAIREAAHPSCPGCRLRNWHLALLLAARGLDASGVDPAQASPDVAHAKPGAERIRCIHADATGLPKLQVGLAQ